MLAYRTNNMDGVKLFCLLIVLCSARSSSIPSGTFPTWSKHYTVEGTIKLNFPKISEEFKSWFDYDSGMSRIDYKNGRIKTFQLSAEYNYGLARKISPDITDNGTITDKCSEVNGSEPSPIYMQPTLPDLEEFQFENKFTKDGMEVEKWKLTSKEGQIKSIYVMSLYKKKNVSYPLKYQMNRYLLKDNYELIDDFLIVYKNYSFDKPDRKVFQYNAYNCDKISVPSVDFIHEYNPMMEFIDNFSDDYLEPFFQEFIKTYNKTYTGTEYYKYGEIPEDLERKSYFLRNVRYIYWKNRVTVGYKLAVNHLADYSDKERNRTYSWRIFDEFDHLDEGMPFSYNETDFKNLPSEFDWNAKGAVTHVKNQPTMYDSGWTCAATGAIEGTYFLKYGQLKNFSEVALETCTLEIENMAWSGGMESLAYAWIKKHGIPTEEEYSPYESKMDGTCWIQSIPNEHFLKISDFVNVTSFDEKALKVALVRNGPISISIHGSLKSFAFYAGGVYDDIDCSDKPSQLNHGALLVGYGTFKNQPFWLVKNSWTKSWGVSGYAMISRKKNVCGIMTNPTYVIL